MLAIVPTVLLGAAFVWSLVDGFRNPHRYERLYDERLWLRILAWVWVIALAVAAGLAIAGATTDELGYVAAGALIASYVCWRFLGSAALNRRMRDRSR